MLAHVLPLLLLASAVSLDGFGAGVTYGLRRIRIPLASAVIIACCSGFVIWLSMAAGALVTDWLPSAVTKLAGALLLTCIGIWTLLQLARSKQDAASHGTVEPPGGESGGPDLTAERQTTVWRIELKRLGVVIAILRSPQAADVDRSGVITASEAFLLGFALSLDAFGAGLGMAMLGFPPLPAALMVALASGLFLRFGMVVGLRFASWRGTRALAWLPGLILILMGLTRLL